MPTRRRVQNQLRAKLKKELAAFGREVPQDKQVRAVLQRCRLPELRQADGRANKPKPETKPKPKLKPKPAPAPRIETPATEETRVWAGVCAAYAERLQADVRLVRAAFILLGIVAAPLAFLTYAALYFELRARAGRMLVPAGETSVLVTRGLSVAAQVLALFALGWFVPRGIIWTAERFLPQLHVSYGAWGWFQSTEWFAVMVTLLLAAPMGTLATLSLKNDWGRTLRLLTRLTVASYAALICFGTASALVGSMIEVIEHLMQ